jgi:hypothetical protein
VVATGRGLSDSTVGALAEEVGVQDPSFLRSASGSEVKLSDTKKPLVHYPVFIHNMEKT